MFNKKLKLLLFIGIALTVFVSPATAAGLIPVMGCFKDFNGNGSLDSGEFGECVATPQGNLCLLDNIPCMTTEAAAICQGPSSLNSATDQCEYPIQYRCTSTGSVFQTLASCSGGCAQSSDCVAFCPDDLTIQGSICRADPACTIGTYNQSTDTCSEETCPYGDAFICQEVNGVRFCSSYSCANSSDIITDLGSVQGENDLQDNGPKSSENECLGHIYIFSGRDRRCRTWGATIAFDDCCESEDYLFGLLQCSGSEQGLAKLKGEGLCNYIGQYCSKEIDLLFTEICVEESKSYCCFNSKLARIVQEQGRAQLSTFNGWGSSSSPNCKGFTPEEFQVLDFSLIDLSEWHGDIQTKSQMEIENNMTQGVTEFYDKIGN